MGIWQKWLGRWARWWNTQIKVNPTQVIDQMNHPVESDIWPLGLLCDYTARTSDTVHGVQLIKTIKEGCLTYFQTVDGAGMMQ